MYHIKLICDLDAASFFQLHHWQDEPVLGSSIEQIFLKRNKKLWFTPAPQQVKYAISVAKLVVLKTHSYTWSYLTNLKSCLIVQASGVVSMICGVLDVAHLMPRDMK